MTVAEKYPLLTAYAPGIDCDRALRLAPWRSALLARWKAFAGALGVGEHLLAAASMKVPHNQRLRVPLAAIAIAESVVGAAIALTPQASAEGQDDNFLALLAQAGIPAYDNIPSVIDSAHQVCQALDGGKSAPWIVDTLANYGYGEDPSHDLGQYHRTMVRFVRVAVTSFCPGNQGKLASVSESTGTRRIVLTGQAIPNPPQIPTQPEPAIKLLAPPAAPPTQTPPPKQAPPPPKHVSPPPPQVVEPPAAGSQGGAGGGGSGGSGLNEGGGSGSSEGVPAQPAPQLPAPQFPEGHIVMAP